MVEFADWNSQKTIGKGCGNNSATGNMGYTDSMPYHTGTTQSSRDTYGLGTQYRNIEGLWDNVYDWGDGCYYNSSGLNIIQNPSNFSDSSGGTAVGVPSNGWPSKFDVADETGLEWCIYPTETGGSETTYSSDDWNFSASNPCLHFGGNYSQNGNRGLFCVNYGTASNSSASIGCRHQTLPCWGGGCWGPGAAAPSPCILRPVHGGGPTGGIAATHNPTGFPPQTRRENTGEDRARSRCLVLWLVG